VRQVGKITEEAQLTGVKGRQQQLRKQPAKQP
jgi:hypothetical protein